MAAWIGLSLLAGLIAAVAFYGAGALFVGLGVRFRAGRTWVTIGAWAAALALLVAFGLAAVLGGSARIAWVCVEGPAYPLPGLGYALVELGTLASGVIVAVVGLVVAMVRRQPHIFLTCLTVGATIPIAFMLGSARYPACPTPPGPTSTTQAANLTFQFTDAYADANLTPGESTCTRYSQGGPVMEVSSTPDQPWHGTWRFGNPATKIIDIDIQPSVHHIKILLADEQAHKAAIYANAMGTRVIPGADIDVNAAADGTSGQITLTLGYVPDEVFDPEFWPHAISGTLSWNCSGPEE